MKKILLLIFCFCLSAYAQLYKVPDFQSDIFSKDGNRLKKVEMSLIFEGEGIQNESYKILDALNIVVSSFYIEDLFTSKGKEHFKTVLKQYIAKKYMIDIDFIYIIKFNIKQSVDLDKIVQELENKIREKNFYKTQKTPKKDYKEALKLEEAQPSSQLP